MKQYLKLNEWCILEKDFQADNQEISESVFSIGNGHMGQRANFEEQYSGKSLQGSYMAGVYYPDKTRVGWWKNGYPEYFAKVLNSTNWIGINFVIDGEKLDLSKCEVTEFVRTLNMKEGYLERSFVAKLSSGKELKVNAKRFISIVKREIGAIRYSITPLNFNGKVEITPYLDADVKNKDSNYDEKFWDEVSKTNKSGQASIIVKTKKLDFFVCSIMKFDIIQNHIKINYEGILSEKEKFVANTVNLNINKDEETVVYKYVANVTSRDFEIDKLLEVSKEALEKAYLEGFEALLLEQSKAWDEKWKESDIVIEGDVAAQQAIRFNIFQLNQTYNGEDDRLNIGPKGFTGEKYGGSTYWDTEAYCIPFYLSTADPSIARNLLIYRYKQLEKAKENAKKLGFKKGALYPMVTMNGEECHNEWEITFEEIHRNGAIAYAIYNYVNYTGDKFYLGQYGLEVLVEISRFWEERVSFATNKGKYVMLGVTGPNEYENNSNNNWYTNKIAVWTMEYTLEVIDYLKCNEAKGYLELEKKLDLKEEETKKWDHIIKNMYYPEDKALGIFLQQDGYLDKEQILVKDLEPENLPLNQKWSWDRILRSCFIKQADVLQGVYLFEQEYDLETIKRNFYFYEQRTVHESSLSPCVHSILAAKIGEQGMAYDMYLRTSRLDLDNYNNDSEDGCHTTSMAGTWMSVIQGFGGMRVREGCLELNPFIPDHWKSFSFKIMFRGALLKVNVTKGTVIIANETGQALHLKVYGKVYNINGYEAITIIMSKTGEERIKAIIFDLDGVIVSTDECHYEAWKQMADEEGIYFDRLINERLRGVSRKESLQIILERSSKTYNDQQKLEMAEKKNNYYRELIQKLNPEDILTGVTKLLIQLKDRGIKTAIGSSSKNTPLILEKIGLLNSFDVVVDGNDITFSKPNPEVFLKAAQFLGIAAEDCLVVEDADAGVEAAISAGMKVLGVGSAAENKSATYRATDLSQISIDSIS